MLLTSSFPGTWKTKNYKPPKLPKNLQKNWRGELAEMQALSEIVFLVSNLFLSFTVPLGHSAGGRITCPPSKRGVWLLYDFLSQSV